MKALVHFALISALAVSLGGCSTSRTGEVDVTETKTETAQIVTGCFTADDIAIELQENIDGVWTHAAPTHYAVPIDECDGEYPNGYVFEVSKSPSEDSREFRARAYGMHGTELSSSGDLFSNTVTLESYSDSITLGSVWQ